MTKSRLKGFEVFPCVVAIKCVFLFLCYATECNNEVHAKLAATFNKTVTINDILNEEIRHIADEMEFFDDKNDDATILTPESRNGNPIQSVIVTTWRTGSTFLGEILNTMPGNYYHFEPLLHFGVIKIRGPSHDKQAIYNLKQLLKCNYTDLYDYINFAAEHDYPFSYNTRLWHYCHLYPKYCANPNFLTSFCKLFPLHSMKVIRLRLALAEQLLADPDLNIRIIYLVRDPRGTMQSRKHCEWCDGNPDCDYTPSVCDDMVADYYSSKHLSIKYPHRFKVIRYEELSLDPLSVTKEIFQFYGLPFNKMILQFLKLHTKQDAGSIYSTYRDSKSTPFRWIRALTFNEIETIQMTCSEAMDLWGYKRMELYSYYDKNFNPLLPSPFS